MKKTISKIIIISMLSVALLSTITNALTFSGQYSGQLGTVFTRNAFVQSTLAAFTINPSYGEGRLAIYKLDGTLVYKTASSTSYKYNVGHLSYQTYTFIASPQSTSAFGSATVVAP